MEAVQPELGFIRLFHYHTKPGGKLLLGPGSARGPVVRGHASAGTQQLRSNKAAKIVLAELQTEPHHVESKPTRSIPKLIGINSQITNHNYSYFAVSINTDLALHVAVA